MDDRSAVKVVSVEWVLVRRTQIADESIIANDGRAAKDDIEETVAFHIVNEVVFDKGVDGV